MNMSNAVKELLGSAGFELVNENVTDRQMRFLGRVNKTMTTAWLDLLGTFLTVSTSATWTVDASKHYFVKGGSLVYGWRIIIQSESLTKSLPGLLEALRSSLPRGPVDVEIPLHGSPTRHQGMNGKGARPLSGSRDSGPSRA